MTVNMIVPMWLRIQSDLKPSKLIINLEMKIKTESNRQNLTTTGGWKTSRSRNNKHSKKK